MTLLYKTWEDCSTDRVCLKERKHLVSPCPLWVDLRLSLSSLTLFCMRNNYRANGVSSAWLRATKWCAGFSLRLLPISAPSVCSYSCLVSVVLVSWDYRRQGQQESTQIGTCARQLFIWMNLNLLICQLCFNTGAPERWAFSLLVISGLIPSYLEGAWHITGIYQHSLGGQTVFFLQKEERIWGHLESLLIGNEAILLFILYFTMMITWECN